MRIVFALILFLGLPLLSCSELNKAAPYPGADSLAQVDSLANEGSPTQTEPPDPYEKYTYAERRGQRLFAQYCAICHGPSGQGDGFNAYNLDPRPHDFSDAAYMGAISDQSLAEVIAQGGRGVNKSILMPAYANTLTRRDIGDLVGFIRVLAREQPEP